MAISTTYKTLFEITILHGYFLNSGETEYNDMTETQQKKLLKEYSFDSFLEIVPTQKTAALLKNHAIISQKKGETYRFGVKLSPDDSNKTFINISSDITLNFIIRIKDFLFENYTDISYLKTQLLYLSNVKPDAEPITFKYIPLSVSSDFVTDAFFVSEETSTAILKTLEDTEKLGVFGIISLKIQGDEDELDILTDDEEIPDPVTQFKIHFNNRKTYWRYTKTAGTFEVETNSERPLTKNGFVEIDHTTDFTTNPVDAGDYQYPNPSAKAINKIGGKTYSEIFI